MNVAILGAGHIACKMAEALRGLGENFCFYAVASRSLEKAEAFRDKYGALIAYGSYEELLSDDEIDLVYIATPHSEHMRNALLCIDHNKNILVEKAFTANRTQAEAVYAAAEKKNIFVAEAMWTRYMPSRNIIGNILESGRIGRLKNLEADFSMPLLHIERLVNPALAGGALLDLGIYSITVPEMFFGDEYDSISIKSSLLHTGVDKTDTITYSYKDGRKAVVKCSCEDENSNFARIEGDKGYIVFAPINNPENVKIYDADGKLSEQIEFPPQINGYEYEVIECSKMLEQDKAEPYSMPKEETLKMMGKMDSIRSHIGVFFPFERKSEVIHPDNEIWGENVKVTLEK